VRDEARQKRVPRSKSLILGTANGSRRAKADELKKKIDIAE